MQAEMLKWAHGGITTDPRSIFDGTLASLIRIYLTDADSPYKELRYDTAKHYDSHLATLTRDFGTARLANLTFRDFKRWHEHFCGPEEMTSRAHGLMTKVRLVIGFGDLLRLGNCGQLASDLSKMTFPMPKRRTEFITAAQAIALRAAAHARGYPSVALAQALQFELMLRQKDVLGEWIPVAEPGVSDIVAVGKKWMHGLHWRDVDEQMILRKRISKSLRGRRATMQANAGKVEEFDLRSYPMVVEELSFCARGRNDPLVICEYTGLPWRAKVFNLKWRELAREADIPDSVQNRDSRSGGITEGITGGASIEMAQKHAGHSTPAMTARYWRGAIEVKNQVADIRTRSRKS